MGFGIKSPVLACLFQAILPRAMAGAWAKNSCSFCAAKGSAADLETQIYIGMEIGYIDREQGKLWAQEASEIQAMLGGLIKAKS